MLITIIVSRLNSVIGQYEIDFREKNLSSQDENSFEYEMINCFSRHLNENERSISNYQEKIEMMHIMTIRWEYIF